MDIIAALQVGDPVIFREVFEQYHKKVYAKIRSSTQSAYLAEEVVQLTFIKLWEYRRSLNPQYELSTQIFRIAGTTLIDLLRKQHSIDKRIKEKQLMGTVAPNDVFDRINERETGLQLFRAMGFLPSLRRQVFEMSRLNGMTYKEIASQLSISEKAVENHIYKATKQLKRHFTVGFICCFLISLIYFY